MSERKVYELIFKTLLTCRFNPVQAPVSDLRSVLPGYV